MDKSQQIAGEYGVWLTMVSQREVPHLSEQAIEAAIKRWPEHERDAREHGIPGLGSGNVYRYPQSQLFVPKFTPPAHWPRFFSLDVGWKWTAALWFTKAMAPLVEEGSKESQEERDASQAWTTGRYYVYDEYKRGKLEPFQHAIEIKARGDHLPGVIDPASNHPSKMDGRQILRAYRSLGLQLTPANRSVPGGILNVTNMMNDESLKVCSNCTEFRREYRTYRRDKDHNIVKKNDHLMDCLRYGVMSGLVLLYSGVKEPGDDAKKLREKNRRQLGIAMREGAWMV